MSEVLRDLVVSLSLDGDNFSRNLTSINKQIQEAESEFRRAASGVENFEKSVSGTQSQLSSLQQKMALQQKAVKQYERALEAANKKLENAYNRQGKLTESLDAAKQKNADLRQQVAAATKQYERFSRELGESDSATLAAKANLDALSQEYAESSAEVKKLEGQLAANTKSLQNNADAVTKARTNLNNAQGAFRQTEQQLSLIHICTIVSFSLHTLLICISNPKRQPIDFQSDLCGSLSPIHTQHGIVVPIKEAVLEMELSVDKRDVRRLKQVVVKQEFREFSIAAGQLPTEIVVLQQFEYIGDALL